MVTSLKWTVSFTGFYFVPCAVKVEKRRTRPKHSGARHWSAPSGASRGTFGAAASFGSTRTALGIAFFLPPVGVGLSIASGIVRVDIDDVSRTYVPYLLVLLLGLALIAAFPWLTLVLPRLFLGYRG